MRREGRGERRGEERGGEDRRGEERRGPTNSNKATVNVREARTSNMSKKRHRQKGQGGI